MNDKEKLDKIVETIERYGMIDGSHHKQWIMTEVLRIALGKGFKKWLKAFNSYTDEDGEEYGDWDEGIPP